MHSWFSVGCRGDVHDADRHGRQVVCWHAARLHHRCRLLSLPDAACESLGSQLRWLWDQRAGSVSPTVFADKLHLAAAGVSCLGAGRDETIVDCVLGMLEQGSLRKGTPFLRRDRRRGTTGQEDIKLNQVTNSGRIHASIEDERLRRLADTVSAPDRSDRLPVVLPSVEMMQVDRRGVTNSIRNQRIATWMASEEGQVWSAERRRLYHHSEPDAVIGAMGRPLVAASSSASAPPPAPSSGAAGSGDGNAVGGRGRVIGAAAVGSRGRGSGGRCGRGPTVWPPDGTRFAASASPSAPSSGAAGSGDGEAVGGRGGRCVGASASSEPQPCKRGRS